MPRGMNAAAKRLGVQKFISVGCPTCGGPLGVINGAWLRLEREMAGLTLREVSRRLSFSAPYICDIEHGRRACPLTVRKFYESLR